MASWWKVLFALSVCVILHLCIAILPGDEVPQTRETLIKHYFDKGLSYLEIVNALLIHHAIRLSVRHLKRLLQRMGLRRVRYAGQESSEDCVKEIIQEELKGSGQCLGYRAMWHRLKQKYGLKVKRSDVLKYLWELDPEGVTQRKAKRLKRRRFVSPGPNFTWHLDGYDKLKPFGFCIHGAVDGYSRKILWLEVGPSNNNPKIIGHYFINCIRTLGYGPSIVRCDMGTENTTVAFLQGFMRSEGTDAFAGVKSFVYGKSTSNQRIEAWWSILRKCNTSWWINFLKDLRAEGKFIDTDPIQCECLQYCFMGIIRKELHQVMNEWNLHKISTKKNSECEKGKPDVMFFMPEVHGTVSYGHLVNPDDIQYCLDSYTVKPNDQECSTVFLELMYSAVLFHNVNKNIKQSL